MAVAAATDPLYGLSYGRAEPGERRFDPHPRGAGQAAARLFVNLRRYPDYWRGWWHCRCITRHSDTKAIPLWDSHYQYSLVWGSPVAALFHRSKSNHFGSHHSSELYQWPRLQRRTVQLPACAHSGRAAGARETCLSLAGVRVSTAGLDSDRCANPAYLGDPHDPGAVRRLPCAGDPDHLQSARASCTATV